MKLTWFYDINLLIHFYFIPAMKNMYDARHTTSLIILFVLFIQPNINQGKYVCLSSSTLIALQLSFLSQIPLKIWGYF